MQALILAAGMGKRLKELTNNNTKCMIKVNGVSLIEKMLSQLEKRNINRIVIVVGYKGKELIDYISTLNIKKPIIYVENPIYDKTNNIYSLALAKDYLCEDDTLLLESDLIFEDAVIDELLDDPRKTLALVDKHESWMDGTCVKLTPDDDIESFIPGIKFKFEEAKDYYKTVNIYKFSKHFSINKYVPFLEAYQKALGRNEYYEQVLRIITLLDEPEIKAKRLSGQLWYEIDDIQDLNIAESMFTPDEDEKVQLLQLRYGGYWRYPSLIDYCYLVNPYYPPKKLIDELKASFERIISQYPSGLKVNSLLAAKNFNIHKENVIVGNGAAELINSLMKIIKGKTGFIRPTFEEYPNRFNKKDSIYMDIDNKNYSYTEKDIITFFDDKNINNLVIINPDNPSGNYIEKSKLLIIIKWAQKKNINVIIDESFSDFSDELNNTLIEQDIVDKYENLIIIKSISKSYGIPGLRLGICVSNNMDLIEKMKKDISIWNINSFAEFYLQIAEKYNKKYMEALEKLRNERKRFKEELDKIDAIRVIPSQANYFMIEIKNQYTAKELTKRLLINHNIFIKDLSKKLNKKNYIRIAIKTTKENNKIISALKEELK